MRTHRFLPAVLSLAALAAALGPATRAQCPTEPRLDNFTGGGSAVCPCFVPGEEGGAVFQLPPSEYPIEILRVGIGWGSQFGGTPQALEEAIHIYAGGFPDPGVPIFTLPGPQLTDGAINEFDLEPLPGEIIISSGPFTVTLEFLNQNAGDIFAPSIVHDGNGCTPGQNIIFSSTDGWTDVCTLSLTGDWVFYVLYRKLSCAGPGEVPDGAAVAGSPLLLGKTATELELMWDPSCSSGATGYGLYEGLLGSYTSHFRLLCLTGGATSTAIPLGFGDRYYLVVPWNDSDEGSYGRDGNGVERPQGGAPCQPTQDVGCL